jgi:hypothetical protein
MSWNWGEIDWTTTFTGVAGTATAVQAVVAVVMAKGLAHARQSARAASDAVSAMKVIAEHQLRAYVEAHFATASAPVEGEPIRVSVFFKNMGQTPARRIRTYYKAAVLPWNDIEDFAAGEKDAERSETTVGPGAQLGMDLEIPWKSWAPQLQALQVGRAFICVAGKAVYSDIFDNERITTFRRFRPLNPRHDFLHATPTGNSST